MEANRQRWSDQQQEVRRLLAAKQPDPALRLLLRQHAMLHAAAMAPGEDDWSCEDEVVAGLTDAEWRTQAGSSPYTIAWLLWHVARTEDATMNLLVADRPQVLEGDGWVRRLGASRRDIGTAMDTATITELSTGIDIAELRAYRLAVGRRTREIVRQLPHANLDRRVDPARIHRLLAAGVLTEDAHWLADVWAGWTTVRFLLIPATRHAFTHLNDARRLQARLVRSRGRGRVGSTDGHVTPA